MALLAPDGGEDLMLKLITANAASEVLRLVLYTTAVTPAEGDTKATYIHAVGSGYANVVLANTSWTYTPGAPSQAAFPQQTFTFSGALGNVFGYYVVNNVTEDLYWAEEFTNGPYNIQNNGDEIKVTVIVTLD